MSGYVRFSDPPDGLWLPPELTTFAAVFDEIGHEIFGADWCSREQYRAPFDESQVSYHYQSLEAGKIGYEIFRISKSKKGIDIPEMNGDLEKKLREVLDDENGARRDVALIPIRRNKQTLEVFFEKLQSGAIPAMALFMDGRRSPVRVEAWRGVYGWPAMLSASADVVDGFFQPRSRGQNSTFAYLMIGADRRSVPVDPIELHRRNKRDEEDAAVEWMADIMRNEPQGSRQKKFDFRDIYTKSTGVSLSNERWNSIWSRAKSSSSSPARPP